MHRVLPAGILVGLLAAPLAAQEPATGGDSLPFRAGLRGAQFGIQNGAGSIGYIRFTSPSRAWVVDVAGFIQRTKSESSSPFGGTDEQSWGGLVTTMVGLRSHRALRANAVWFSGGGLRLGYSRESGGTSQTGYNAGVYGELGASYHVSPRMSFGAQSGAGLGYGHNRVTFSGGNAQRSSSWSVATLPARLNVMVYF